MCLCASVLSRCGPQDFCNNDHPVSAALADALANEPWATAAGVEVADLYPGPSLLYSLLCTLNTPHNTPY